LIILSAFKYHPITKRKPMRTSEFVDLIAKNNVTYIKLLRTDKYNAFVREMAMAFQDALKSCAENDEVRAICIVGSGKAFSAGQDLAEAIDPDNGLTIGRIVEEHYNPIIKLIRTIEKPIIAAINGVAAGAGANIALACDITIASEQASFIQAFSKIGLIPDSAGTFFLPRLVGFSRASGLMMTGDKISGQEAYDMGMIYKVYPEETFEASYIKMAEKLASSPTMAIGLTKRALNESAYNDLEKQLDVEKKLQSIAGESHDYKEGIAAFLEKRKPNYKGK
jgi:2-(1,2-epoxy-1,2-dihydrophenyl)acetyl-CoA isomerase